ncbi:MAG: single-stranded-DNA-specific exonuclease RecJ [Bacteroidota bacterium]
MKNWIEKDKPNLSKVKSLAEILNIPFFICSLLIQRNIDSLKEAQNFFRPNLSNLHDPFLLKDIKKAIKKIEDSKSDKIMILGDYDVDGTTSTAMLYKYFNNLGYTVSYYIPDRYKEGYGVSINAIDHAIQNNIKLIITVDCGIKAIDQINYASLNEIDVIICDHHLPDQKLPKAYAIINPKQSECKYPFKELCGCGIAFKLISAHNSISKSYTNVNDLLDFVALATISDMMPMIDENRILVYHGLKLMNQNPRLGLQNFFRFINKVDESNVSFNIGPRINASGRMKNAKISVDLLVEENPERAITISNEVEYLNQKRREAENNVLESIISKINANTFSNVIYGEGWSSGVLGIVASRVIEQSYKPSIILTDFDENLLSGSVRSVPDFDVYSALKECDEYLFQYGGHKYAAGLKIKKENLDDFINEFEKTVKNKVDGKMFERKYKYDLSINFSEINLKNAKIIQRMSPFGLENIKPTFRTNNCRLEGKLNFVGKEKQIVKSVISDTDGNKLPFISFKRKDEISKINSTFDILYTVGINSYSGQEQVELTIKEISIN